MKITDKKKKIVVSSVAAIFLILLYMLIFSFSEQDGETSGGLSRMISEKCVALINALSGRRLSELMMESLAAYFENPIRKLAHFCEYAVMSGLLFGIWYPWLGFARMEKKKKSGKVRKCLPLLVKIIIPWVFVSAALDEIHQLFVPGRCGNFWDVLLDTAGGCFGLFCCVIGVKLMIGTKAKELAYAKEHFNEVLHTTLNPGGPGVVRIHLVPPKITGKKLAPGVAIINGQDVIAVNRSWCILLAEFIREVNKFAGHEVSDAQVETILENTYAGVRKIYPRVKEAVIREDIYRIMHTFTQVARGERPDEEIGPMSMGEYAVHMKAPHRMDVMVSAMTKNGGWHCNQKCIHCYAAGQPQAEEQELSTGEWKQILDKCREIGIPQITFTGGEPTMREDLPELIAHARWFMTRLNTNGVKLTKEYCEQLKEAELDSMQITFYSHEEAVHNQLVGAGNYEKTLEGIKNALAAGINISINTPLCKKNKDYVETLKFLKSLGVEYVTCSGLITTGNATTEASVDLQLTKEEIKEVLKTAVEYCFNNGMEISFTSPGWIEEAFFQELAINIPSCGACLSNMAVTPGGNVVPCQSWLTGDVLGNILEDKWEDIWNSDACVKRREYSADMTGKCPLRRE